MGATKNSNFVMETSDRTATARCWTTEELEQFMQTHLDNVTDLSPESRANRTKLFSEIVPRLEYLRVDIECIEIRLDRLEETILTLEKNLLVRKTGHKFMEEKLERHNEEYTKKCALLREKRAEQQALLNSLLAIGRF